ncbi:threonine synthase [Halovivax cerinus]|uniref:Threonine synthase n=1 Tax=Halovivax cerinus TaxID=1487865 RepID=A0ABD5NQ24_9EURY|nr:threonine synthase [Halovivax cerinus]
MRLECLRCGRQASRTDTVGCDACGGALSVRYDATLDPDRIAAGETLFERYGDRLPSAGSVAGIEGETPLVRADRLASSLDVDATVYVKDERRNPTSSFKDRAYAPAVSLAAEEGEEAVVTASTGNAAAACALYAARADLPCYLLVAGNAPAHKLTEPLAYGARAVRVDGLFDGGEVTLIDTLEAVADQLGAYLAFAYRPFNPVLEEGIKTISYEVAEALEWTSPDVVVTATGGGDNLVAQHRGFRELHEAGLVETTPRMVAAQAAGASAVVDAIERDAESPIPPSTTDTVASGIDATFASDRVVEVIRESGGTAIAVSDEALLDGERTLAKTTGVWAEPASAVVVPVLTELAARGTIGSGDVVVLTVTGSGHKHVEPFEPRLPTVERVDCDPDAVASALRSD